MNWHKVSICKCRVGPKRKKPYLVRWYGEIDPETGRPKRYSKSFRLKAEAERFRHEKEAEIKRTGRRDRPDDESLQRLCADFLRTKKPNIRPASLELYEGTIQRLLTFFGPDRAVSSIQSKDADLFLAAQLYRQDGKTKLSDWTRIQLVTHCRSIFGMAVRWNMAVENCFANSDKPKGKLARWHYMKPAEYLRLLDAAPDLRWKAFYALAYTSGARFGELFNLTWSDIDFDRAVVKIDNRRGTPTMPAFHVKDHESRTIPLPEHTLKILLEYQAQAPEGLPYILLTAERYKRVLNRWRRMGMVDDRWQNRYMANNTLRDFRVHARRAGLDFDGKFSLHTFRKCAGQNWALAGVTVKTLMYLMGHSNERTTLSFYQQVDPGQATLATEALDAQLTRRADSDTALPEPAGRPEIIRHDSKGL